MCKDFGDMKSYSVHMALNKEWVESSKSRALRDHCLGQSALLPVGTNTIVPSLGSWNRAGTIIRSQFPTRLALLFLDLRI